MFNLKTVFWLCGVLVVAAFGGYYYFSNGNVEVADEYVVQRKTFEEAVQLTGRVQPSQEANLSFEKSGTVKAVYVKVGEVVKEGDVLAALSNSDVNAKVLEARASYNSQLALLQDLSSPSRYETVDNKRAALEKADTDLNQAYKNAGDSIRNLAILGNTYVRDNLANSFSGNLQNGYTININSCDTIAENAVNLKRSLAEKSLINIEKLQTEYAMNEGNKTVQKEILTKIKNIYSPDITDYLTSLKNIYSLQCLTINTSLDTTRSTIATARSGWSTASSDLSAKINLLDTAKTSLVQAENDLKIASTGEKNEKIKQQEANTSAAYARLLQAQAEADKHIVRAPFAGVVTNIDMKVGELITAGSKSISLISENNFEIESKVSEVDVAKLQAGAKAQVTFDAYGESEKFQAIVSNISPAGIISEGVPTYKTIFTFVDKSELIRSGMTANIKVVTKVDENAIAVPAKYIYTKNGDKFVKVKKAGTTKLVDQNVKTNGVGVDGNVEILEGLSEHETIIFTK
jgi:RND family efflux transporter MFP subunit